MRKAGDRVRPILASLGLESGLSLALVRESWAGLFPGPLARHAAPSALEGKTLVVTADSSAWVQQLTFLKPQMLEKLTKHGVADIRFMAGRVTQPVLRSEEPRREPSQEDMEFVEALLAGIRDPGLSESVRAALDEWVRRPQRPRRAAKPLVGGPRDKRKNP